MGYGTVVLTLVQQSQKDLPIQFRIATKPLKASVVLASFGPSQGFNAPVFEIKIDQDTNVAAPSYEKPLRYGKQPEINHTFRADPKSPPKIISLIFGLAVIATLPALLIGVSHTHVHRELRIMLISPVGNTWRKRQPPIQGYWDCPPLSCRFLWVNRGYGVRFLPVLHQLEFVPGTTGYGTRRRGVGAQRE